MNKKVFAFDLGKASIGFCVRENFDILEADSLIINKDHAECISNCDRRRVKKTIVSHKKTGIMQLIVLKPCCHYV